MLEIYRAPRFVSLVSRKPRIAAYAAVLLALAWYLPSYLSPCTHYTRSQHFNAILSKDFGSDAINNLTHWRDELFANTIRLGAAVERRNGKVMQPEGHSRFDLFNPIVSCPKGEQLEYYGGTNDGENRWTA